MSLIEVLIALAMAGILSMVIASILDQMQKQQRQGNIINTIESQRASIQRALLDGKAWGFTVNDAANNADLTCLRTNVNCTGTPAVAADDEATKTPTDATLLGLPSPAQIVRVPVLYDGGNAVLNTSSAGNEGYSATGGRCNTWAAAGNDTCPIRWEIMVSFICPPGPPTCLNPNIEAFAVLRYSPLNSVSTVINPWKYRVRVMRGSGGNFKAERLSATRSVAGQGAITGLCGPAAWIAISLDGGSLVNEVTPAGTASIAGANINLPSGTYTCSGMVTCFACGTLKGRLLQNGAVSVIESPAVLVGPNTVGQAIIPSTSFTMNGPGTLQLQQYCDIAAAGNDPSPPNTPLAQYGQGMAMAPYGTGTVVSSLSCIKVF